jgi:hypothetical protein
VKRFRFSISAGAFRNSGLYLIVVVIKSEGLFKVFRSFTFGYFLLNLKTAGDFRFYVVITFRTVADVFLLLGTSLDLNDGLLNEDGLLEIFDVGRGDVFLISVRIHLLIVFF